MNALSAQEGDPGLAVFPEEAVREGILVLRDLAQRPRRLARDHGFDAYLNVNVHLGPAVCGPFGPAGSALFELALNDRNPKIFQAALKLVKGRGVSCPV